jgi:hypothetical protein
VPDQGRSKLLWGRSLALRSPVLALGLILSCLLGSTPGYSEDTSNVPVPCLDDSATAGSGASNIGFRPCKVVLDETGPSPLTRIKKYIQGQIDAYYGLYAETPTGTPTYHADSGVDYDFMQPPGPKFGPTVCNVNENTLVSKNGTPYSEISQDHLGKSCGTSMAIKVQISVPKVGDCAAGKPSFSPSLIYNAVNGSLEEGYFRGSLIQATSCYYNNVLQDIKNKKMIVDGPMSGVSSACSALAQDLRKLMKDYTDEVQILVNQKDPHVKDLQTCSANAAPKAQDDPAALNILQLCSVQQGIEDAFVHLARCEIFSRAQNSYWVHTAKQSSHDELISLLKSQLGQPCSRVCNDKFYKASDTCHAVPSNDQVSDCITSCYRDKMPGVLKAQFQKFWTSDDSGVCQ